MISPCILVIDDEVRFLEKLEAVMRRAGYRVLTANNGNQGVYLAQAAHPEVIICDVAMPSPNALEVKGTLADDPNTSSIPFIFMTTRTAKIGTGDSISKPFNPEELVSRVNAVIRSQAFH